MNDAILSALAVFADARDDRARRTMPGDPGVAAMDAALDTLEAVLIPTPTEPEEARE
ncbi:MAG: hypothetical protein LC745_07745 [Planctomycetia bacterium]|nr:hypothetical protein [Planctomycetia bacterium]